LKDEAQAMGDDSLHQGWCSLVGRTRPKAHTSKSSDVGDIRGDE